MEALERRDEPSRSVVRVVESFISGDLKLAIVMTVQGKADGSVWLDSDINNDICRY